MEESKRPDMNEFPFTVPSRLPTANSNLPVNTEKLRVIACIHCKYRMPSHIPAPICGVCGHEMLTIAIVM